MRRYVNESVIKAIMMKNDPQEMSIVVVLLLEPSRSQDE